ncbi:MAG: 1-acyl-sn-glycerol-3-phosphate acyltransferase [Gammaproteobacteria bacterium]|nr:1-acyl-sn-glycerol-3-phosphate acyltransferase [Gammaproteobacteria bacterium]NND39527.1 acyltransferase [Pseudomonadales bacterium]
MAGKIAQMKDRTIFDGFVTRHILKLFFRIWFSLFGWRAINQAEQGAGVTIAAPHTSNVDFFYALGAAVLQDIKIYFSIKQSWCDIPVLGRVMLWLGAMPIDRSASGQVEQIRAFVDRHKHTRVYFIFTPEGTRGGVKKWKTGFYHIAQDCGLPVFLAKVDYRSKISGVFHSFQLTDNKQHDIEAMQASYTSVYGRNPEQQFPAYLGPLAPFTANDARIMQALYALRGMATRAEIAAKARFEELSSEMLEFLTERGILEKQVGTEGATRYRLTARGSGCLLHLRPSLA